MADYSSVLSRAVAGKKTYEERRAVYDRARNALVNQLRSLDPPLAEADITRQRLALEEAIRKIELALSGETPAPAAEPAPPSSSAKPTSPPPPAAKPPPLVRSGGGEAQGPTNPAAESLPPPALQSPPPRDPPPPPARPAPGPSMRREPAFAGTASPLGEVVREAEALGGAASAAARSARDKLDEGRSPPRVEPRLEPPLPAPEPEAEAHAPPAGDPLLARVRTLPATEPERPRVDRKPLLFGLIAALIVAAVAAAGYVIWRPSGETTVTRTDGAPGAPPKTTDRVPADPSAPARPGGAPAQPAPPPATVTQNAYLYEENADNPRGADSFRGTVTWRIDTENAQGGPERLIRGLIDIPERGLKMLLTVRRNMDQALPASHTVELLFDTPQTFVHGAVENVAGLRMKPSEQANGLPLVGASARITPGYFLIGLSNLGPDRERNVVLLRDRPWMDLPILYRNGRRAVIAIEKGPAGERVFTEAFQAWGGS